MIFSACELGVFNLLLHSQKPLSAAEVSRELGTSEDGMERLLDVLVGIEILEVEIVEETGEVTGGGANKATVWFNVGGANTQDMLG